MTDENPNRHPLRNLFDRYHYFGVAIALIGGVALVLVIFKDIIFGDGDGDGGGESTLGTNSFISIAAVGILIIFAIVVDA